MGEMLEGSKYIVRHGEGNVLISCVMSSKGNAEEFGAGVVSGDSVEGLESGKEVIKVGFVGVFHVKVVDNQGKFDRVRFVNPEGRGVFNRCITIGGDVADKTVLGDGTGLFKA